MPVRRMTDRGTFRPHEEMNQQFRFRNQCRRARADRFRNRAEVIPFLFRPVKLLYFGWQVFFINNRQVFRGIFLFPGKLFLDFLHKFIEIRDEKSTD